VTRHTSFAPGKIIISGEYAVVFGETGIAIPAPIGIRATFMEDTRKDHLDVKWLGIKGNDEWDLYLRRIIGLLERGRSPFRGTLTVMNQLPLQKGLGSSTALVIAVSRALIGKGKEAEALAVEDQMNPGHSGIDFAVIWQGKPLLFRRGNSPVSLQEKILDSAHAMLIDTGKPNETTPELVAGVKARFEDDPRIRKAIKTIGKCTERIRKGEDLRTVFKDHHRAQVTLGIVPKAVQTMISEIERLGGAAKVIGAGGKASGGMVLALHKNLDLITPVARKNRYPLLPLSAALNP